MATKRQLKKATKAAEAKAQDKIAESVEKAAEVVEEVKETVKAKAKEVKAEMKEEKAKNATAKKEIKTDIVLQYGEKEVNTKDMVAAVKKEWTKAKNKVSDIKSMELYVKPEDYAVYYVINGDTTGKIWL